MKKFMISRVAIALRFVVNKRHLSSIMSFAQKTCSLVLIMVFGLAQLPIHSEAKAQRKARLVFDTAYLQLVTPNSGFSDPGNKAKGKSIRSLKNGSATYEWVFPETIGPQGATAEIKVTAQETDRGGGITAIISCIGIAQCSEVSVVANFGDGLKTATSSFKLVPQPAYESQLVYFSIRCHGGFDVVFRYIVEQ